MKGRGKGRKLNGRRKALRGCFEWGEERRGRKGELTNVGDCEKETQQKGKWKR